MFKFSGQQNHVIVVIAEQSYAMIYPPRWPHIQNTKSPISFKFNYNETMLLKASIVHEHHGAVCTQVGLTNLLATHHLPISNFQYNVS